MAILRELSRLRDFLPAPFRDEVDSVASRQSSWEGDNSSFSASSGPSTNTQYSSPDIQDEASLREEASEFFADLNNYLALGCLTFEDFTRVGDEQESDQTWDDLSHRPPLLAFDGTLNTNLQALAAAGWIRIFSKRCSFNAHVIIMRIFILPFDVGLKYIDRQSKRLYLALESLTAELDVSRATWSGHVDTEKIVKFDMFATADQGSLFWMFNKIPSPAPVAEMVQDSYAREALEDLLDSDALLPGLKTRLYPYQRRSAGLMLQRESVSCLELDPRLERRIAPDGTDYHYGARDITFFRHPRYYEACRGGILAETMGLGKTVICLALIMATKDHPPKVPAQYGLPLVRSSTASLLDMAISNIHRKSIPWKVDLAGHELAGSLKRLELPATYEIPLQPTRWNRKTIVPPPKRMMLANTTVIVSPPNLAKQWQSEIGKHVDADLRVLVLDHPKKILPPPEEIRNYDILLFTRNRFEGEIKDGSDEQGRRMGTTQLLCRCPYIGATRIRDCSCLRTDELYDSPLKHVHFKRLIVDEGHFFSNTNNTSVSVANKLITADSRWVISGTPAKDLLGVEVDMTSSENLWQTPNTKDSRDAVLEQRRHFSSRDDTTGAIRSLGALATSFLRIKPWAMAEESERGVSWDDHIFRHESLRKRTYSGFSTCLRQVLNAMVVKTQPEDVERDLQLPELHHEVIRLEPSFYDKLTANLFTLVLTANAVTSEREDADYLFHAKSQKARTQLIANLRQSAFFWTGFSEADVHASVKSSNGYLSKDGTNCAYSDRNLLTETLKIADTVLGSDGWKALSRSHELGLFVEDWPAESAEYWTFDGSATPLLTGISQLIEAQKHVDGRFASEDPGEGLAGVGIKAVAPSKVHAIKTEDESAKVDDKPILTKSGIPTSSIDGEPLLRRRNSTGAKNPPSKITKHFKVVKQVVKPPKKKRASKTAVKIAQASLEDPQERATGVSTPAAQNTAVSHAIPADSPYLKSRVVGTTSAKLSYLISQVLKYYQEVKILIFYDGENTAYYIAQMLELLNIKHNIYAKSLASHLKSEYVVRFDQEQHDRVLLMDVRNAAFGLNLGSASRIYFVNPVCRPNIEAQAIKRAHRIGQTRPVYVETLVLKGTIEEKMLERSKRMTRFEHLSASHLEDDVGIRHIIQSARVLPISEEEKTGRCQMAPLEFPQQLWFREGFERSSQTVNTVEGPIRKKRKRRVSADEDGRTIRADDDESTKDSIVRRKLAFVDADSESARTDLDEIHPYHAFRSPNRAMENPTLPAIHHDRPPRLDPGPANPSWRYDLQHPRSMQLELFPDFSPKEVSFGASTSENEGIHQAPVT